jgi:hypothetical protein
MYAEATENYTIYYSISVYNADPRRDSDFVRYEIHMAVTVKVTVRWENFIEFMFATYNIKDTHRRHVFSC